MMHDNNQYNSYSSNYSYRGTYDNAYRTSPALYVERKSKKTLSNKMIALMLCATMVVSTGLGFGGGILANRMNSSSGDAPVTAASVPVTQVNSSSTKGSTDVAAVAAATMDSVVEIRTESVTMGNRIMGQYVSEGAGSGVIISSDGYIVTNNHVIDGASKITVKTKDGTEYAATLLGTDAKTDLAVLKIDAQNLIAATYGTSSNLVVGESVVAIGNPLGELGGTVTNGIISALDRDIDIDGQKMKLLQTNASVNPGNSGGGLFDANGTLVGIVNAKSSGSGIEGLGFAIPIDTARPIIEEIIENGYVSGRVDIGMTFIDVDEQAAYMYRLSSGGVYVSEVSRNSAAENAGIRSGDQIKAIDGKEITSVDQLEELLDNHKVGDQLTLTVQRGGKTADVEITLEEEQPSAGNLF